MQMATVLALRMKMMDMMVTTLIKEEKASESQTCGKAKVSVNHNPTVKIKTET